MAGTKSKKGKKKKSGMGMHGQILLAFALVTAIVFMGSTILLIFGMLPTVVAAVIDGTRRGTKALTVGAMNLAGCTPFLIELWTRGNTPEVALEMITDPRTVIVIYCAAAIGYLIDWSLSGLVANIMVHRSAGRIEDIKRKQAALVQRWGREVTGEVPLDEYGFPIETVPQGPIKDTEK